MCVCVCVFFFVFFFVLLFFFLQNAPIAMIFDDAIYLFVYFLHFIPMLLRPSPIKTIQKMGERNEKKKLQQQTNNYHTSNVI